MYKTTMCFYHQLIILNKGNMQKWQIGGHSRASGGTHGVIQPEPSYIDDEKKKSYQANFEKSTF